MINTVLLILISAWTVFLAVIGEREKTKKLARRFDLITSAAGALTVLGGAAALMITVSRSDGDLADWAMDTAKAFAAVITAVFALLFVICVVTSMLSWANPKLKSGFPHKLRIVMIAVSTVFIMVVNYFSYIGAGNELALDIFFIMIGAGLACVMRLCSIVENRGNNQ